LENSPAFRHFAFTAFSARLHDLIVLINEIAFGQLDVRLAAWLAANSASGTISATHQAIATELGSAREAVSRLLKEFERKGWLKLDRGQITILQPQALKACK
ncbi:MAG TPA: helix-turn-helix domain-containing protein, partial [Rhizobiales bacterium]|nr:helix-turn-helix domain-containing protein [Hyphomicrobiales bacterium]